MIEQAEFRYSAKGKAYEKTNKNKDQGEKQLNNKENKMCLIKVMILLHVIVKKIVCCF